nr:MAG TPA: hypothetical protein [Caudoviricetes sp.]
MQYKKKRNSVKIIYVISFLDVNCSTNCSILFNFMVFENQCIC